MKDFSRQCLSSLHQGNIVMSTSSSLALDTKPVEDELNRQLLVDFTGERKGYVQVGSDKWFFPVSYTDHAAAYLNFEVRPDDVWVVTFPRSGTTWTQELVWLVANDLDFEFAQRVPQVQRFPFFEFHIFMHEHLKTETLARNRGDTWKTEIVKQLIRPGYEVLCETPSPRFIKTHLPLSLLPTKLLDTCKVIYVARNPKDVAVSYYHLHRLMRNLGFVRNFGDFWPYFENDLVPWAPFWKHIQEGWERKHHRNLKFLFYEDMNKNLPGTIREVARFLDKSMNEVQVAQLAEHLNITNFRCNPAVNFDLLSEVGLMNDGEQSFIRKGKTGGWREEFTPELNARADKWINANLNKTDLRFPN